MSDIMSFVMSYITTGEGWKLYRLEEPAEFDGITYDAVYIEIYDSPRTAAHILFYFQDKVVRKDVRFRDGRHETLIGENV